MVIRKAVIGLSVLTCLGATMNMLSGGGEALPNFFDSTPWTLKSIAWLFVKPFDCFTKDKGLRVFPAGNFRGEVLSEKELKNQIQNHVGKSYENINEENYGDPKTVAWVKVKLGSGKQEENSSEEAELYEKVTIAKYGGVCLPGRLLIKATYYRPWTYGATLSKWFIEAGIVYFGMKKGIAYAKKRWKKFKKARKKQQQEFLEAFGDEVNEA